MAGGRLPVLIGVLQKVLERLGLLTAKAKLIIHVGHIHHRHRPALLRAPGPPRLDTPEEISVREHDHLRAANFVFESLFFFLGFAWAQREEDIAAFLKMLGAVFGLNFVYALTLKG